MQPALAGPATPRFDRQKAVRILAGVLGIVGGLAAAFFAGVFTGLGFWLSTCDSSYETIDTWICTDGREFEFVFNAVLPLVAAALPLAGGIATAITGKLRWLLASAAVAALIAAIALEVSQGRASLLS